MKQTRWSVAKTSRREAAVQAACARLGVKGLAALLDALLRLLQEQDAKAVVTKTA